MYDSETSQPGTTGHGAEFPERFRRYATGGFGDRGKAWLEELPDILDRCCAKWDLTLGPPTDEIKGNYIAYVRTSDNRDLVLKVGVPHRDFTTEMEALAIYAGRGINRLVNADCDLNAMLLERVKPGTMLAQAEMDPSEQAEIAGRIIRQLRETPPPATHGLPHFNDWVGSARYDARNCEDVRRSDSYLEQFPRVMSMMERLMRPDEPQILLHGDLHHWNILLDAIRVFSDTLGESEERMFAGAFCDMVTSCSWGLKHEEDEGEATGRETLAMMVEIARNIDDAKLDRCAHL
jgi:streptomycin 6-kinase